MEINRDFFNLALALCYTNYKSTHTSANSNFPRLLLYKIQESRYRELFIQTWPYGRRNQLIAQASYLGNAIVYKQYSSCNIDITE
uniref:Uncharacterized protein n=1 Tax=Populus trichocarpa TaxID=3694 RepID=U5FMR2_POPTR